MARACPKCPLRENCRFQWTWFRDEGPGAPYISLVFREMWDTTAPSL